MSTERTLRKPLSALEAIRLSDLVLRATTVELMQAISPGRSNMPEHLDKKEIVELGALFIRGNPEEREALINLKGQQLSSESSLSCASGPFVINRTLEGLRALSRSVPNYIEREVRDPLDADFAH